MDNQLQTTDFSLENMITAAVKIPGVKVSRSDFLERDRHFSTFVGILDCITDDIQKNFTDFCAVTDDIVMLQICIPIDLQMFFLSLWF